MELWKSEGGGFGAKLAASNVIVARSPSPISFLAETEISYDLSTVKDVSTNSDNVDSDPVVLCWSNPSKYTVYPVMGWPPLSAGKSHFTEMEPAGSSQMEIRLRETGALGVSARRIWTSGDKGPSPWAFVAEYLSLYVRPVVRESAPDYGEVSEFHVKEVSET